MIVGSAILGLGGALGAQGSDSLFKGFEPTGDFVLFVDGQVDQTAGIYQQSRIPAFLVLPTQSSSPFLLVPRTKAVQTVHIMKITKQANGDLDLAADAVFEQSGEFRLDGTALLFEVDGHSFRLADKPPLLGLHRGAELSGYSPSYARLADEYQPAASSLAALRSETRDVHVRVYFGSWCPFCGRYVPRIVRVAREIAGSKVKIDFYGFPPGISGDPVAAQAKINSVPTGVVFVNGREVGRLQSDDWNAPEKSLERLLGK